MTPIEEHYDIIHMNMVFMKQMEGRQYGEDELRDAHAWFEAGWKARAIPDKKDLAGRREFFDPEEEIAVKANIEGWNECRREMLK